MDIKVSQLTYTGDYLIHLALQNVTDLQTTEVYFPHYQGLNIQDQGAGRFGV